MSAPALVLAWFLLQDVTVCDPEDPEPAASSGGQQASGAAEEKAGRVDLVYKNSVTAYKNSKDRARDLMKRLGQEEANLRAAARQSRRCARAARRRPRRARRGARGRRRRRATRPSWERRQRPETRTVAVSSAAQARDHHQGSSRRDDSRRLLHRLSLFPTLRDDSSRSRRPRVRAGADFSVFRFSSSRRRKTRRARRPPVREPPSPTAGPVSYTHLTLPTKA